MNLRQQSTEKKSLALTNTTKRKKNRGRFNKLYIVTTGNHVAQVKMKIKTINFHIAL